MKSRPVNLAPMFITGVVLLFSILLHALSRNLAERPYDPTATRGEIGLTEELEAITYDARVKLGAASRSKTVATNIATVFFDDVAIEQVNDGSLALAYAPAQNVEDASNLYPRFWPWPRFIHGQIVRELATEGAIAVGFDIMFPELAPTCNEEAIPMSDGSVVSSDQFFGEQIGRAGNVYLAVEQEDTVPHPLFLTNSAGLVSIVSKSDFSVLRRVKPFQVVRVWHPMIRAQAMKVLQVELPKAFKVGNKVIIPKRDRASDSEPAEIPLNPNGTMKLTQEGDIDFSDDPDDEGPQTEFPFMEKRVWNLGLTLAAKALGLDLENAAISTHRITLRGPNGTVRVIPLDGAGYFYIDWSIRLEDLKAGRVPVYFGQLGELLINDKGRSGGATDLDSPFKDRIVVVGSIASGNNVSDFGATPLESRAPLVTKHLNIANSILTGRFVERTSLPMELILIGVLGILSALLTWRVRVLTASIAIAALSAGYILFTVWMYLDHRYWIPMVMPVAGGFILPHFSLVTYRVVFEQREQRRVRGIFSKIVSPDVVQELLSAEKIAALSGARRTITVFFADVRGFTEFTDSTQAAAEEFVLKNKLTPEQSRAYYDQIAKEQLETVNTYLATIADTIKEHRGTLDKYMGDCVMAFWGAPIPNKEHAVHCVRAAVAAQRALHRLNEQRQKENERRKQENEARATRSEAPLPPLPVLSLGTGINTGSATVGLMGSDATFLNYSVFGREVNLASRLEGASGRGRILISESTLLELKQVDPTLAASCIAQAPITPKGFRHPIQIHEVPWRQTDAPIENARVAVAG